MRELLIAAAERAIRYLEGLDERNVAPDPTVVARLLELDIPLPAHPFPADETVALLDFYSTATMAMVGPRFFGFVLCSFCRSNRVWVTPLARRWKISPAWPRPTILS